MKQKLTIILAALMLAACTSNEAKLKQRAEELCRYIPDHELREESKDYMTADFYAVLDTMFNLLPEFEAMDHEWLHYFVTGNGGTIADYTVTAVEQTDDDHAVATIQVRQQWEDGSFDSTTDVEVHTLYMEHVDGQWLMSDFDGHKADCIRHIAINRDELAMRDAIGDYLIREIGEHYLHDAGKMPAVQDICIPTLTIVASERADSNYVPVLCDCWVFWYTPSGDTLKCVSGGNHSGLMSLEVTDGKYTVTAFEQTADGAGWEPSARRIFGSYYDVFQNIHSNHDLQEDVRREQLRYYLKRHNLPYRYYQDYGWPAVEIEN
ncbi:MAG: hypothetical protein IKN29_06285 [Bacteroidales bacterium]|nr:hypothetical protein [Bacteroidales bacterium]